jgi:hypothetical protein
VSEGKHNFSCTSSQLSLEVPRLSRLLMMRFPPTILDLWRLQAYAKGGDDNTPLATTYVPTLPDDIRF